MDTNKNYSVNPKAESILDGIATTVLIIGWLIAIAGAFVGIMAAYEEEVVGYAVLGVLGGALILLIFYVIWARLKVIVNMSRNLFNIHEALLDNKATDF